MTQKNTNSFDTSFFFQPRMLVIVFSGLASCAASLFLLVMFERLTALPPKQPLSTPQHTASVIADTANETPTDRWEEEIEELEKRERDEPTPNGAILFLGSSNIRMWDTLASDFPDHHVVNRGFGGALLSDVAHFADRLIGKARPSVVVVSAGGNDIHTGRSPEDVQKAFSELVDALRNILPEVRIVYLATTATTARISEKPQQQRANELVAQTVAQGINMEFVDLIDVFLGPDGLPDPAMLLPDELHPSAAGNAKRAAIVRPLFQNASGLPAKVNSRQPD